MKSQLGQLMFIGLKGTTLGKDEADFIVKNNIGGVILFTRNFQDPEQLRKLCDDVQALAKKQPDKLPLFIGADQEGGRVQRFRKPFTVWPPTKLVGDLDSTSVAFKFAMSLASELSAVGVNVNFAPSVDVLTNAKNTVIGDRALGTDPEHVAKIASAVVRGLIKGEVLPCAKHFPGHGNTLIDSHEDLPTEDTDLETLKERELVPFKKTIRARLDMLMTCHVLFKNIDPEYPATLSHKIIHDLLRTELRYRGLIVTDDLGMGALAKHYDTKEIPILALNAGCDLLLYCNEPDDPPIALEAMEKALESNRLSKITVQESYTKIVEVKRKKLPQGMSWAEGKAMIGHSDHMRLAEAIIKGDVPADLLGSEKA